MKKFTKNLIKNNFQMKIHTTKGEIIKISIIGRQNPYLICETITNDEGEQLPWMASELYDKESYYNTEKGNRFYFSEWDIDYIEIPEKVDYTVKGHTLWNKNPGYYKLGGII